MKKTKKTALTAAMFAAALGLTACNGAGSAHSSSDEPQEVYGPPAVSESEPDTTEATEITALSTDGIETFAAVYGPPPANEETDPPTLETTTTTKPNGDVAVVYGPPPAND